MPDSSDHGRAPRLVLALFLPVLTLALYPYTPDPATDIKELIAALGAGLLAGWLAILVLKGRVALRWPGPAFWPLAALLVIESLTTLRAPEPAMGLRSLSLLTAVILLYYIASQVYTRPRHLIPILLAGVLGVAASSIYGMAQWLGWDPFPWDNAQRGLEQYTKLPATFGNPNLAGHALLLAIILAAFLAPWKEAGRLRWIVLPVLPLLLFHIYLTGHRAGILGLFIAMGLVIVVMATGRISIAPARRLLALTAIAAVLSLAAAACVFILANRNALPLDTSTVIRANSFHSASRMIQERPLGGWGPGRYVIENPRFWTAFERDEYARGRVFNEHPHNEYLAFAIDAGLPAAAAYIAFLGMSLACGMLLAWTASSREVCWAGLLTAALFAGFATDSMLGFNFRAPVSALMFAVCVGALNGLASAGRRMNVNKAVMHLVTSLLILAGVLLAGNGIRQFISRAAMQRGSDALYQKAGSAAARILAQARRLSPWDWRIAHEQALAARTLGDFTKADAFDEEALAMNPAYVPAILSLGRHAFNTAATAESGSSESATRVREYAARIISLYGPLPGAVELLGRLAILEASSLGDTDVIQRDSLLAEADDFFATAIANGAPDIPEMYRLRAKAAMMRGDYAAAWELAAKGPGKGTPDDEYWRLLAALAKDDEKTRVTRALLKESINRSARRPELTNALATARCWLANILEREGEAFATVEELYQMALEVAPDREDIWGWYYLAASRSGETDAFTKRLFDAFPTDKPAPPVISIVIAGLSVGDRGILPAASMLIRRVEDRPSGSRTGESIAWAAGLLWEHRPDDENEASEGLLALQLGRVWALCGMPLEAEPLLDHAAQTLTGQEGFLARLEWSKSLLVLGRSAEAAPLARQVAAAAPDNPDARLVLADALAAIGEIAAARLEYRSLLMFRALDPGQRHAAETALARLAGW